jgi:predicted amino acid racemase
VFLETTLSRNPALIETAFQMHRRGQIPPNCYVVDLEAVTQNARILRHSARENGLELYFTTKQVGFNPLVQRCAYQAGLTRALAIDPWEARVLAQNQIPIGHLGHLVQPPDGMLPGLLRLAPDYVTVYSLEKARRISQVASQLGRTVHLLLRVIAPGDFFHPGQEGGIPLENLVEIAGQIARLPDVCIRGVTSYPCLQVDANTLALLPTPNFSTILQAAEILRSMQATAMQGIKIEQINAPGNTCAAALPLLARLGATHGEAGHALTGTTYLHAAPGQPELSALVYVSEISHLDAQHAYLFGGGLYRRSSARQALVQASTGERVACPVLPFDPAAIDYYISLALPAGSRLQVGDGVLLAARAQVFVSRSLVAAVDGVQSGKPELAGLFDAWGRPVENLFLP